MVASSIQRMDRRGESQSKTGSKRVIERGDAGEGAPKTFTLGEGQLEKSSRGDPEIEIEEDAGPDSMCKEEAELETLTRAESRVLRERGES